MTPLFAPRKEISMKKVSVTLAGVVLATIAALALPTTASAADDSVVHIKNKSDWEIHHFFLSPSDQDKWGPDQLGNATIAANGGSFELHKVPCDTFDVKLVDEDGDECVVQGVDICASKEGWVITNDELLACEGNSSDGD
jgi:hypothetical protein